MQFIPRGMGEQGSDSGGSFSECVYNDTVDVSIFINSTDPDYFSQRYSYIIILLTMAGLGSCLNLGMMGCLLRLNTYRNSPLGIMLMQLFFSNVLVSIFCLFTDGIWNITVQWHGGDLLCRMIKFLQMLSLYATTLILTGLSVETCITITFPLSRCNHLESLERVRLISITAWLLASLCSIPQAIIFHIEKAPICTEFYQCVTHGFYSSVDQELAYHITTLFLMYILPLVIIIACHIIIFIKISGEARIASGEKAWDSTITNGGTFGAPLRAVGQGTRAYQRTRQVSLWLTFITAACFVVCWVPYYAMMFGYLFQWNISHETLTSIFCLGMSYSVINPLIFGVFLLTRTRSPQIQRRETLPELLTLPLISRQYL